MCPATLLNAVPPENTTSCGVAATPASDTASDCVRRTLTLAFTPPLCRRSPSSSVPQLLPGLLGAVPLSLIGASICVTPLLLMASDSCSCRLASDSASSPRMLSSPGSGCEAGGVKGAEVPESGTERVPEVDGDAALATPALWLAKVS